MKFSCPNEVDMRQLPRELKFFIISLIIGFIPSALSVPILAPTAHTESVFTVTVGLILQQGSNLYLDYSRALSAANTFAETVAVSIDFTNSSTPNLHSAQAGSTASVSPTPSLRNNIVNIASISTTHNTAAMATTSEPLIAKGVAGSTNWITGIGIWTNPNTPFNVTWNVDKLDLEAKPTSSFAIIRDTIHVIQQTGTQTSVNSAGFVAHTENGKTAVIPLGSLAHQALIQNWLDQNLIRTDYGVSLNANDSPLSLPFVLTSPVTNLGFYHSHTEASYEVPPRAAPQIAEKAGYKPTASLGPNIHWNFEEKKLSFDPMPINILSNDHRDDINPRYQNDALAGGKLIIDPLYWFTSDDGREYFSGDKIRIYDKYDNLLFQASLPTIVYDDGLQDYQGFDLFGPILNIEKISPTNSVWLVDFLDELTEDLIRIPEIFVDLPWAGEGLWNQSFDLAGKVLLSFTGFPIRPYQVFSPNSLALSILGLIILILFDKRDTKTDWN
jgi:hypothetical protein